MADFTEFSGMLQTTTSSFVRRPNQLLRAINVNGDEIGSITKRLGYAEYGTTVQTTAISGLSDYNDVSGGNRYLVRYVNGTLEYSTGGAWTTIQGSLLANAKVKFAVFLDTLFGCGANSANTFLTTFGIDGTSYSTATNLTDAPKAKYVELYKDRLYLANVEVGGSWYPDRFYFSSVPTAGSITWTGTDFERVYTDNGEEIMGLHTNKVINELLIFKVNSLHSYDTYRLRDCGDVGTTSGDSIQTINGITYFFNENGISAYDGTIPKTISRPIQKWIDGIDQTKLGDVFSEAFDKKYYKLYVGNIAVDGKVYYNCEIRFSTVDNTWTIYSYADDFQCYAIHTVSGVTRVYAGDDSGNVMKLADKDDTVYSDNGTAISAEFMFETNLGVPSERKFIDKALIYATNPQNLKGRIRVKGRDWSTYFDIEKDEYEVNVNPEDGRFLQWHFSESSTVNPFIFQGVSFQPHLSTKYIA